MLDTASTQTRDSISWRSATAPAPSQIADAISSKQRLYRTAFATDLSRLRATHGEAALAEALQLVERNRDASAWDQQGHRDAVARAVDQLVERKARDPDGFDDATKI